MFSFLETIPPWAGSVPLWLLCASVAVAFIRVYPRLKELGITERQGIAQNYINQIIVLKTEVEACRRDCDAKDEKYYSTIRDLEKNYSEQVRHLENELLGRDRQRIQEQISLIMAIMNAVGDNPQLSGLLKTLESVQVAMRSNVLHSQPGNVIPNGDNNAA
jgi:hypothetical protein